MPEDLQKRYLTSGVHRKKAKSAVRIPSAGRSRLNLQAEYFSTPI